MQLPSSLIGELKARRLEGARGASRPPDLFVELSYPLQVVRLAPNLVPNTIILLPMLQFHSVLIYNLWQGNSKGQGAGCISLWHIHQIES
ncbi:hypothetical protein E5S67_04979 [Microcoleus sp. IPMA8]|uniref:Uncharacterized protein n=1 Tax=Microcoleus asticus IPMA8 TaxID=2563858 RepID=A0ABX2D3J2_9CYAN|nr:hypothetical protein [Microcoleus asticus IPMA8]